MQDDLNVHILPMLEGIFWLGKAYFILDRHFVKMNSMLKTLQAYLVPEVKRVNHYLSTVDSSQTL